MISRTVFRLLDFFFVFIGPILAGVFLGVVLYSIHLEDVKWNEEQYRKNMSRWYDCTLPSGVIVRANYVHTYRGDWVISTGKQQIRGSGNLTCTEVKP
jgi:hypothetical protein